MPHLPHLGFGLVAVFHSPSAYATRGILGNVVLFAEIRPTDKGAISNVNKLKECEKQIYSSVRLFTNKEFLDSLTVSYKLLENPKELFRCLDEISQGHAFTKNKTQEEYKAIVKNAKRLSKSKPQQEEDPKVKLLRLFPFWFNTDKGASVHQWICAFLEESLVCR